MTLLADTWEKTFGASESAMLLETFGARDFSELRPSLKLERVVSKAIEGENVTREDALYLAELFPREIPFLLLAASAIRNRSKGKTVTYSKNVFVPLTQLCRDRCGYCTFKIEPGEGELFMTPEEIIDMAKKGAEAGCTELLFVTGDKPELAYEVYRDALGEIGYETTAEYLIDMGKTDLNTESSPTRTSGSQPRKNSPGSEKATPAWALCSRT